ncbi:acyl carrier protein [Salpingoeca rosetta]|uniref:Acyl carrier protein n=1 Tax=Salpingoeca rosetta (strain ATCC 50818 / BSB-021) TaxID=946362 RepID=F2UG34_SALR5|nr:acyl carrier protein [Salpingoeca rosetta]EGD75462.1 acyl carrier protein [Salpingoeca rosetta]|eukprot:XP_004991919.1 acyl carrier protein [Salpingoeca rosetta]
MSFLARISRTAVAAVRMAPAVRAAQATQLQARFRAVPALQAVRFQATFSQEDVESRVLNILQNFNAIENKENVSLDAHFINDLGLDSLDAVEIVMAVEDEFSVEISDQDAEKVLTARDVVKLVMGQE